MRFRLRTPYLLNQNILKTKVKKGGQYRKARIFRNTLKKGGNNYRNAIIFNNALNEKDRAHELKFRARTPY